MAKNRKMCIRDSGIVPEKCDLNSILFLLTPAESHEKLAQLVAMLAQFEQHIEDDSVCIIARISDSSTPYFRDAWRTMPRYLLSLIHI